MSANEQQKFEIIGQFESGKIDRALACQLMDVSERTLRRYVASYKARGLLFLKHGNCGKKPSNAHPYEIRRAAQRLVREIFFDFNMTHARELIENKFQLKIPRETFRRWCHEIGMVKQRHKRRSKPRYKRERHSQEGLLVQFDGSPHRWFGDHESCLIAGIDDASSKVLFGEFCESENTLDCLRVLRSIIEKYGIFKVLYVDRAGLYGGIKRRGFSQVTRALGELDIHVIYAQSPEGKGRVERLFRTLQDRLVPELRLNKICKMETANKYLQEVHLPDHNRRFGVKPRSAESAFTAVPEGRDLRGIFCIKEFRTIGNDHTISICGHRWRITSPLESSLKKQRIEIRFHDSGVEAFFAGKQLAIEKIKPETKLADEDKVAG